MTEAYDRQPEGAGLKPGDPVIILARLSKKVRPGRADQDYQQGIGIDTQDKRSREWCERERLNVVAVLADYKSGRVAPWDRPTAKPWVTRPELMAQYKGVIAYKNDRLSRGAWEDEIRIRQWASQNGKILAIVDGPQWPPRDDGDFWSWTAQAKQAEKEWIEGRERSVRTQQELRERGMLVGRPPWGYESAGEKYNRTIIPTDQGRRFIPEIFERVRDGHSLMAVARWLDTQGAKPSNSKSWSPKSVAKIIHTRTYTGNRLNSDGVTIMRVPKLVDVKLWRQANKRLDNAPIGRRAPSNGRTALLTGVLFCARCKAPMYRINPTRMATYYRCSGHHPQRKGCGNMVKLEATDRVVAAFLSMAQGEWNEWRLIPGENYDVDIADVMQQLEDLPKLGLPDTKEDAERKRLRAERDRLERLNEHARPDEWKEEPTGKSIGQHFMSLDFDGRRNMMLDEVKFYAEKRPGEPDHPVVTMGPSRLFRLTKVMPRERLEALLRDQGIDPDEFWRKTEQGLAP